MSEILTGGCQCRRIRYEVPVESDEAYLSHCGMCRHATGGVSIAFASVSRASVRWSVEPDWYRSSPIAARPFCSICGTPLGFAFLDGDGMDACHVDDRAWPAPSQHLADENERPDQVNVQRVPPVVRFEFGEGLEGHGARRVDEDVEAAVPFDDAGHGAHDRIGAADVKFDDIIRLA